MPFTAPSGAHAPRRMSRRRGPRRTVQTILATVAGAALAVGLAACSSGPTTAATSSEGTWSYTDGSGTTFALPAHPKIVTTSGMYFALHDLGVDPIGVLGMKPKAGDPGWKGVDIDKLKWFGTTTSVNVEALAAAKPDAVIAQYDKPNKAYWGYGDDTKGQDKTRQFTKLIGFDITGSVPTIFGRISKLATGLGADPNSATTVKLKEDFERAGARVKAAVAEKPGITVARIGTDKSGMTFGCTSGQNDIAYWKELGVKVQEGLGCNNTAGSSSYWGTTVSWENVANYPTDILIDNSYGIEATRQLATTNPVFAALPAIKAGQLVQIETFPALSYSQYITNLNAIAAAIEKSKVVSQ